MTVAAPGTLVTTTFAGARSDASPVGTVLSTGRANYLMGSDSSQWRTHAPVFAQARYSDLYPGIDLLFYGSEGSLEYDFVVRPGADPHRIVMDVSGTKNFSIDRDGALVMGAVRWKRPVLYQVRDGVRQPVQGRFVRGGNRVSFQIGAYDKSRDLVIDPTLVYASYLGGSDNEGARGIAADSSGNYYITGFTFSQDIPHTGGSLQPAYHGGTAFSDFGGDAFVAKYNSLGALVYVTYLGGRSDDCGMAIAADSSGNAYVAGWTSSSDFPTTTGAFQTKFGGGTVSNATGVSFGDAFVAKLNPSGNALVYSTYLGGSGEDKAAAIAVDSAGNAYVGGATLSTNFPTRNPFQAAFKGAGGEPDLGGRGPIENSGDGFVAKLNAAGSDLVYSTYLGGSLNDAVTAIAIDASGNAYAGGATLSKDFPTASAFQATYGGGSPLTSQPVVLTGDGFVSKLDSTGKLSYSTYLGGSADDAVMGIAVDSAGAAYVTGFTSSGNFPTSATAAQKSFKGPATITGQRGFVWGDGFAAKLSAAGTLAYSTYLGGAGDDAGMAIAVDASGNAYVGGFSWSSGDFPITADALQRVWGGTRVTETDPTGDGFLTKVSPDGGTFVYSSYLGGVADEAITGVAVDSKGTVYTVLSTTSTNLTTTTGAAQSKFGGEDSQLQTEVLGDAFVAVFSGLGSTSANPVITSVVNAFSNAPQIAPGTAVLVTGTNLPASASAGATIGGVAALVNSTSTTQWTIVIPPTVLAGATTLQIGTSAPFGVVLSAYAPAMGSVNGSGTAVSALHANGDSVTASAPAIPGESIEVFATGLASAALSAVTATIGGVNAPVSLVASTSPGLYQVNMQVPSVAAGNQNVVLSAGGVNSPALSLPVGQVVTSLGPSINAVVNGASFQPGIAANAWFTITGANLSPVTNDWSNNIVDGKLPTTLDTVSVTVGGQPAYVDFVSPTQINAVAPNVAAGTATVVVKNSLGTSAPASVTVQTAGPAFFLWPNSYAVATRQDFSYAVKNGEFSGLTTIAAKPGDVLILWGSGFGPSSPPTPVGTVLPGDTTYFSANPVTVTLTPVGGGTATPATVYGAALAPGYAALYQVAIQVPASLAAGDYSIVATVAGAKSPSTVLLTVQP